MIYKAPKKIITHPGVQECEDAQSNGCVEGEYRHDVFLREGWQFTTGRMRGIRSGLFKTVNEFIRAAPMKVSS